MSEHHITRRQFGIGVHFRVGTLLIVGLFLAGAFAGCGPSSGAGTTPIAGDPQHGAVIFTQSVDGTPPCNSCHSLDGSQNEGPSLKGVGSVAGTRIKEMSAVDYLTQSIKQPAAYLVNGYGNVMYNQYANHLGQQQIADLVAYLLTLK